jgi:hypothetical protein
MGWLDKLLGRGKKTAGDMADDSSMKREGMGEEQAAPSSGMPPSPEPPAQEEGQPPSTP